VIWTATICSTSVSRPRCIASVIRDGMFVDLFGQEIYISLRKLSYQRWIDATAHYQSGQRAGQNPDARPNRPE
jgi:hypothetical protein